MLRDYSIKAAGNCNGALPSYEGELRKRPLGVQNEGTATAFVTCSLPGDFFASGNFLVAAAFTNQNSTPVTVNCTLVDGATAPFMVPAYYPQSITLPANGVDVFEWTPAGEEPFTALANLSCNLPPGVAINVLEVIFMEDNGVEEPV